MSAAYNELEKIDIVDKLNNIGNNYAISTDGLAVALQASASALKTAGNDMDEAVALVTAGNAVVQDPNKVGAGLRTIALRITGTESAREELEALGEDVDDFVVQTTAKSQQTIKDFTKVASNNFEGFDILDDNGNFKSTYEILLGISEIYEEIVATDKKFGSNMANGLLEALAGKNRANIAASILQNPELLKSVYESSQDSSGSAQEELDKYLDSIEGKIQQFTNEVQEFWYNLISSETIKTVIDAGTAIVDIIGDIVGALGEVGTIATTIGTVLGGKAFFGKVGLKGLLLGDGIKDLLKQTDGFKFDETIAELSKRGVTRATAEKVLDIKGYNKNVKEVSAALDTFGTSADNAGEKAKKLEKASKLGSFGLNLLKTAGVALASAALSMVIQKIAESISEAIVTVEEAQEATDSMMKSFKSAKSEADENAKSISKLKDEYASLMKGVNSENNMNLTLSTDDYERYLQLNNEIANMYPSLVKGYDEQGNAILDLQGRIENLTAATEDAQRAAYALAFVGSEDIENSGFDSVLQSYKSKTTGTGKWYDNFWEKAGNFLTGNKEAGINISYDEATKDLKSFIQMSEEEFKSSFMFDELQNHYVGTGDVDMYAVATALGMSFSDLQKSSGETLLQLQKQATSIVKSNNNIMISALSDMQTAAEGYLKGIEYADGTLQSGYDRLSETQQDIASKIITNMTFDNANEIDSQADLQTYVDDIVDIVSRGGTELSDAYSQMMTILTSKNGVTSESLEDIVGYIDQISVITGESSDHLKEIFGIKAFEDTEKQLKSINKTIGKTANEEKVLSNYTKDFNNAQKQAWLTAVKGCTSAQDAIRAYEEYMLHATSSTSDGIYNVIDAINEADSYYNKVQSARSEESYKHGDTYDSMYEAYKEANEFAKNGDVGNEIFKSVAAMFSRSGADDLDNWKENLPTIQRYFQEDTNAGAFNFLKDLEKHGYATYDSETKSWSYSMEDLAQAAKDVNLGFEPFMAMLDLLEEKGFHNDFFETEADGMAHLTDLTNQLAEAEAELYELEQNDPGNSTAIEAKKEEIEQLKGRIDATTDSLEKLLNKSVEDRKNEDEKNQKVMSSIVDQYNENYGDLSKAGQKQWRNEIISSGEQYGFTVTVNADGTLTLDTTDAIEDAQKEVEETTFKGTVDLTTRPTVSSEKMNKAGWDVEDGSTATVDSVAYSNEAEDKTVLVTPILPDGSVLKEGELADYANKILAGEEIDQNILIRTFEGKDSINQSNLYAEALHRVQDAYYLGDEAQKKALNSLKGYTDGQLKAVDLYDKKTSAMEDSLLSLMDAFGLSSEHAEQFINVLSDMGLISQAISDIDLSNLDALKEKAQESQNTVQGLVSVSDKPILLDIETTNIDNVDSQIESVKIALKGLADENGNVSLETDGVQECIDYLSYLNSLKAELSGQLLMSIDTSKLDGDVQAVITKLTEFHVAYSELQNLHDLQAAGVDVDTTAAEEKVNNLTSELQNLPDGQAEILAKIVPEPNTASSIESSIGTLTVDALATIGIDSTAYDTFANAEHTTSGEVQWDNNTAKVDAYISQPHTATGTVNWGNNTENVKKTFTGKGIVYWETEATGTAHSRGTAVSHWSSIGAYAGGTDWRLPRNETALVNEVGTESIVRDGRWFPIPGGAHVEKLQKGDIIFNAAQTEELMRTGKVISGGGHGRIAYANGTAFGGMNAYPTGSGGGQLVAGSGSGSSSSSSSNNSSSESNSSSKDDADEFKEILDWIERKIKDIERDIDNLDQTASATYKSWSERNSALTNEMAKVTEEIDIQKKAYERYMQEADSVGLSDEYKQLVQEGKIDIETITDEELAEQIKDYQNWYDKAIDCQDAVQDLQDNLAELTKTKFENVVSQFEDLLSVIEHTIDMLDGVVNQIETEGYIVSTKVYEALKEQQENQRDTKISERNALIKELEEALATPIDEGGIAYGSSDYYEMLGEIQACDKEIQDLNTDIAETNNLIRETPWNVFDKMQEMIGEVNDEADFYIGLMSDENMFNPDDASITKEGQATFGLHGVKYNTLMSQADDYLAEIAKLDKELEKDPFNQTLLDQRQKWVDSYRDIVNGAEDEKQAIIDLVKEGYDTFLSVMDKAIDKRKEMLSTTKDLYDYEKNVSDQVEEISKLEKQLKAYGGDTSEATKATVQQLKVSLEEAKENLEETEYERYIQDQEKMLDSFRDETQEWIDDRLQNPELLLQGIIDSTNNNAQTIKETLEKEAGSIGTTLSNAMSAIWAPDGTFGTVVTTYTADRKLHQTTVEQELNKIRQFIENMSKDADKKAGEKIDNPTGEDGGSKNKKPEPEPPKQNPPKQDPPKQDPPKEKEITVGSKINAGNARIYANSRGTGGGRQYFANDPIYTVIGEENGYVRVRWHKASSGSSGWFKKSDVKAYSTGGLVDYDGLAAVHGGKKPELVLNSKDTENFIALKDVLKKIDSADLLLGQEAIASLRDTMNVLKPFIDSSAMQIPQMSARSMVQNVSIEIGDIQMYGVNDPEAFAAQLKHTLQTNKSITKIIQADTLGIMTGKNGLSKFKY